MSEAADATIQIDRDAAIDMAVYSGNLLYSDNDEAHAWALTVIVSNLFELIGEGDTSADRFADGFGKVSLVANLDASDLGWDYVSVAKAIRNWIDHGLHLDRPQEMNSRTRAKAIVNRIGFIPISEDDDKGDTYRVYSLAEGSYELFFSPARLWASIQRWGEVRTL
ncbi:MAG: hypothetical protein OXI77_08735 [Chloroflexota bacterium]|nr:hypothetical protein [Chloroflexota bacterium]MDE2909701.1 hypothetical protein [Chloroflexota bacterium]